MFFQICPREMVFRKNPPKNCLGKSLFKQFTEKNKTTCYFWLETEPPCEPINKYTISFKFHFLKLEGQVRIFVRKILVVHVIVFARGQIPLSKKRTIWKYMKIRDLLFPCTPPKTNMSQEKQRRWKNTFLLKALQPSISLHLRTWLRYRGHVEKRGKMMEAW